ncbi:MAG TPA: ABC transporter substrate-binding protein [Paracoccaceae bacterium]|nr:ABC transporter substrate-binding protein [Paracoccaceae bacterium]
MKRLLSAAATAALLTASGPALAQDGVPVGSIAGITGPVAELVAPIVSARNLAAEHVNAGGGLLDGRDMVLIAADSQCDPKAAVDAANKVVNVDQVVGVIGATCSGGTNALAQAVTIPAGIPSISDSATAPSISELDDNGLVFRTAPSDAYQGEALANVARDQGIARIAVTYANDDYNAGIAKVFERVFEELGGEVTASQVHEPNKASYRAEVTTLAQREPEAMALFAYYGGSGITIVKNALETGSFGKFFAAEGMFHQSLIDQIGADNLRGNIWVTQAASDPDNPGYGRFAETYQETGYDPRALWAAHGYDAAFLMALAIEKAGSTDGRAIADALTQLNEPDGEAVGPTEWEKAKALIAEGTPIDYQGASGSVDFDENGDVPGVYSVATVGEDGTWQTDLLK